MNDKNKRVYYEVTANDGSGWTYHTMKEALNQLTAMRKGFPDNIHMTDENRNYWIKIGKQGHYHIVKVTETREEIL